MYYWPNYFILKRSSVTGRGQEIPISLTDHFLMTSWPRGLSTMECSLCGMTWRILPLTKRDRLRFEGQTWRCRSEWIDCLDLCIISVAVPEAAWQQFSSLQEQMCDYIYIYIFYLETIKCNVLWWVERLNLRSAVVGLKNMTSAEGAKF